MRKLKEDKPRVRSRLIGVVDCGINIISQIVKIKKQQTLIYNMHDTATTTKKKTANQPINQSPNQPIKNNKHINNTGATKH